MTSSVSIASNALIMLGAQPINSFDEADGDNLDRARLAANLYPTVRDSVLRSHPWNCATKRVVLAPLAAAPAHGWTYQFALPGDWLRTLSIGDEGSVGDYAMEAKRILTNGNSISLRYIARVDESTFDAQLVECMEIAMAARMAYAVTSSAAVKQTMDKELEMFLRRARATNGQEDTAETVGEDGFLSARLGGYWSRSGT